MTPPLVDECATDHTPESLVESLAGQGGVALLRSALLEGDGGRYSFVAARPFLRFRSHAWRCEIRSRLGSQVQYGNPWRILQRLLPRYELLTEIDLPFPLGGCFGYWGYDLKNAVEPGLPRRALNDLGLPDCQLGFYGSLVAFDHHLGRCWIISTGQTAEGSRDPALARNEWRFWRKRLTSIPAVELRPPTPQVETAGRSSTVRSSLSRGQFLDRVERAQRYIRAGDIYQVNVSQRLSAPAPFSGWDLYRALAEASPAPYAAYLHTGDFEIASSSPELFLRMSGGHVLTRPIKGTRPRGADPTLDLQLAYELQTSAKELAELVMITDLLRNDLGRVAEYGSVTVPELVRLERFAHVQHLVSTVEGQLRPDVSHLDALCSCFPGGSITGAPKIRAMEIIDELEPVTRGPYTGALGYVGFNRESQLSILIRAAVCASGTAHFHVGAGIVADSVPAAEYEETLAKARGFLKALRADTEWRRMEIKAMENPPGS